MNKNISTYDMNASSLNQLSKPELIELLLKHVGLDNIIPPH